MDPTASLPTPAKGRVALCALRFVVAGFILAIFTLNASAIGPDLPLQFHDLGRDIELTLESGRFNRVDVVRIIYDRGRPLREQHLDLKRETRAGGVEAATVPLELELLSNMPPG